MKMTTIAACKQSLPGLAWQTDADGSCVGIGKGFREKHWIKVWTIDGHWQAKWYRLPNNATSILETLTNRRRGALLWAMMRRIKGEAQALANLAGGQVCW